MDKNSQKLNMTWKEGFYINCKRGSIAQVSHYHLSVVLIWLKYWWKWRKIASHPPSHPRDLANASAYKSKYSPYIKTFPLLKRAVSGFATSCRSIGVISRAKSQLKQDTTSFWHQMPTGICRKAGWTEMRDRVILQAQNLMQTYH